jgi:micrococcal nuclease
MPAGTLVAGLAALILLAGCGGGEDPAQVATVERVIDGDTLVLADGRRVRLVQIDAPEEQEDECYARQSSDALAELAPPGGRVTLEPDPALDDVDRFDRLLRYVVRDDLNANLELVRRGAAAPWFFDGDRGRYADDLLDAAEAAQEAGRGLWGACAGARLDPERGLQTGG